MQVDLFDKIQNIWVEGSVVKVDRSKDQVRLEISKKGFPKEFNVIVNWPDNKAIAFCGE